MNFQEEVLNLLKDIKAGFNDMQKEFSYNRKSKYTSKEIIKINSVATTPNIPQDKATGLFTSPVKSVFLQNKGSTTLFVNVNETANVDDGWELVAGEALMITDLPIREVSAVTASGTGKLFAIGFR